MPYDTQQIKRDQQNSPIPQHFNPTLDVYEALLGRNGANRVELYGPDGNPLIVTSGKLDVKATDAEAILTQIRGYVDGIEAVLGEVQVTGSYATIDSAPVVGVKTVTTTAAELFARASRLANRYVMIVYNESSVPVYWGPPGVTTPSGFPLLPQDSAVFQFSPSTATAIYFIASSSASVRVVELA